MSVQQSTEDVVKRLRERFLSELETKEELYHKVDIKRVRTDDWQIERFVITQENEDKAYEAMVRALQWKKSFGVHERTEQYFPIEFYENFQNHTYGTDREGRLILWEKTRTERNISNEINVLNNEYIANIVETLDNKTHKNGYTLVTDTNGAGLSNINMAAFKFKIEIMDYYPESMRANYMVDLPWVLKGVSKIILSWCNKSLRERIHYINRKDLATLVDPEIIPLELGGKRDPKIIIPDGAQSFEESATKLGLTDKHLQMYYKL